MFVRKLILLFFTVALLAPIAEAKAPKQHKIHSKKTKKSPKAKWGSYRVKNKHS